MLAILMCDHCEHNLTEDTESEKEADKEDVCCGGNCEDCKNEN